MEVTAPDLFKPLPFKLVIVILEKCAARKTLGSSKRQIIHTDCVVIPLPGSN